MQKKGARASESEDGVGQLASIACGMLMKVICADRPAQFDLATQMTKWAFNCDLVLNLYLGCTQATKHLMMIGWVGGSRDTVFSHLFVGADFAGDVETQRATSGFHAVVRGARALCPSLAGSKRQTCVSHSNPEDAFAAADFGLPTDGLPSWGLLWRTILPHKAPLIVHEDTQAMMRLVTTLKTRLTTRYLQRTQCVCVCLGHMWYSRCPRSVCGTRSRPACARTYFTKGGAH